MSTKTIEIASIHKGTVRVKVKGEGVPVTFEDKGDVGVALCDHDEAAAFLQVGLPDFWKPGVNAGATTRASQPTNQDGESHNDDGGAGAGESDGDSDKESPAFVAPYSIKHNGGGKWQVLDATGAVVEKGLTKDEAEAKTIELNTPE